MSREPIMRRPPTFTLRAAGQSLWRDDVTCQLLTSRTLTARLGPARGASRRAARVASGAA
jgi:hypothetical protein